MTLPKDTVIDHFLLTRNSARKTNLTFFKNAEQTALPIQIATAVRLGQNQVLLWTTIWSVLGTSRVSGDVKIQKVIPIGYLDCAGNDPPVGVGWPNHVLNTLRA